VGERFQQFAFGRKERMRLRRTHFEPDGSQEIPGFVGASPSRGSTSPIQSETAEKT
jgi:hypothetical protein